MIRLTVLLALVLVGGCHSSKRNDHRIELQSMKTEKVDKIARELESKVHAKPKKWEVARKHINVDAGVADYHWSSADESLLVYIAVKDDATSALQSMRSASTGSSGQPPEVVQNLGENACITRGRKGCNLNVQQSEFFVSISAATEERAREFAEAVLESLPR